MTEENTPKNEDAPAPAEAPAASAEPAAASPEATAPDGAQAATTAPDAAPPAAKPPEPFVLPPTIPVKSASAPLWQWVVVGGGGLLAMMLAARSATTLDDSKPVIMDSRAVPLTNPAGSVDVMPQLPRMPALNTAPLLTVSAGPLAGGFDSKDLKRDAGKTAAASSAKKGKDSYPSEGAALDAAQEALNKKDAAKATAILDQYDKDWGAAGMLGPDAQAARVEAMALKQQDTQALALANRFLEDYPHSPKAGRVRGIADQLRARGAK